MWVAPALAGSLLVLFGVLIFLKPELLAYLVATAFVVAGLGILAVAWRLKRTVVYRRVEIHGDSLP